MRCSLPQVQTGGGCAATPLAPGTTHRTTAPKAADRRQHSAARCWTVRSGTDLMASRASRGTSQRRANYSSSEQKTARTNALIQWLVGLPVIEKAYPRVDRSDDYENQSAVAQLEHDEETDDEKCDSAPGEDQRLSSSHPPSMPR